MAERRGHHELLAWLRLSRDWTPLHHIETLTAARARELLRGGADIHAGSPSPLERALQSSQGDVSAMVRLAAAAWSPLSHHLFPEHRRRHAAAILRLGYLLAWSPLYVAEAQSLIDAWVGYVMPHALHR